MSAADQNENPPAEEKNDAPEQQPAEEAKPAEEEKPAEEAKPAENGAAAPADEEAERKQLEEQIAALEKETAALNEAADADEKKLAEGEAVDAVEAERGDIKKKSQKASEDKAAAEAKIADQQAEYDRVMANKDLLDRRDACKRDIDETEAKLSAQQDANAQLEAELEKAQASYKKTRDQRADFVKQATEVLDALKEQVAAKIHDTIDSEEITSLDAFELIELLSDLVARRERELSNNQRLLREVEAIIELKRETAERLESESEAAVTEKRRERAEAIKRLIYGFQEERNTLQADIEEVRRVNVEQSGNLQRGHVSRASRDRDVIKPATESLTPSGRRKPVKRVTAVKQEHVPTPEEQLIMDKNAEVERELNETLSKVGHAQQQKTALTQEQKSVKHQMVADKSGAESSLRELEAKVVCEVERVRKLNHENARLADAVKHLTDLVRVTKQQVERIRGHTAPLPIEED